LIKTGFAVFLGLQRHNFEKELLEENFPLLGKVEQNLIWATFGKSGGNFEPSFGSTFSKG